MLGAAIGRAARCGFAACCRLSFVLQPGWAANSVRATPEMIRGKLRQFRGCIRARSPEVQFATTIMFPSPTARRKMNRSSSGNTS